VKNLENGRGATLSLVRRAELFKNAVMAGTKIGRNERAKYHF
jgi:hypothetical protein